MSFQIIIIRTYHSSVLGRGSLRSAMLEVERAMVDRALVEEERGLVVVLASGFNLSTGGMPAGKSAERFLKARLV